MVAVKGREMSDVLTPLAGGHVFAGTWEETATDEGPRCSACGSRVEPGAAMCPGWGECRADALDRLVRGMIREAPDEQPNGPTEAALVAFQDAHIAMLDKVLPLLHPMAHGVVRAEGDRLGELAEALADDARALRLAYEASSRQSKDDGPCGCADAATPAAHERHCARYSPLAPADRVTAEELAEVARLDAMATPGPWHVMERDGSAPRVGRLSADGHEEPVALVQSYEARVSNAELMAWSRTLLPKLATSYAAVEQERDRLAAEVTALRAERETFRAKMRTVLDIVEWIAPGGGTPFCPCCFLDHPADGGGHANMCEIPALRAEVDRP